jgi:hypothetical protein
MKTIKLAFAAALFAGMQATGTVGIGPLKQIAEAQSESATHCVQVVGLDLRNNCDYTIEVTWCVEGGSYGYDCNGSYRGTWTLSGYGFYPHFGGDKYVRYAACKGANTIAETDGYSVFCN